MKLKSIIMAVAIALTALGLPSCGFGHSCAKLWQGTYTRYSGDNPIYEQWDILLDNDGSCAAINTVTGNRNYKHEYTGTWVALSDDVIKVDMKSEPYSTYLTQSYAETDYKASKAQTAWKRSQVYADANRGPKYTVTTDNQTFYIRSDGATSFFVDKLDTPIMKCK